MSKLVALLFIVIIFKSLIWIGLIPVWQTPDEQAHFAQLQYYAENKTTTINNPYTLSSEVLYSEEVFGTRRDDFGNNKYTYHQDFNIPYSGSTTGYSEKRINTLPLSSRTTMVATEAAMYPPAYYIASLPFYYAVYFGGLIDRIFAARIASLLCGLGLAVAAYFIGRQIWQEKYKAICLAILVGFQPMVSFVSAGYHPDNLLNLLYSIAILLCLTILRNGLKVKYLLLLGLVCFLGTETKWLMLAFLPVTGAFICYRLPGRLGKILAAASVLSLGTAMLLNLPIPYLPHVTSASPLTSLGLVEYLKFRIPKVLFEAWPWYWGVFKWLGVVFPPLTLKIITRVAILCILGLVIKIYRAFYTRKFDWEFKIIVFSLVSIASYAVYLLLWDWRLMQSAGFSSGIQGRYFFPNIVLQMFLFAVGGSYWFSIVRKQWERWGYFLLAMLMVLLNFDGLYVVAKAYYSIASLTVFIDQVSQYKPVVLKGNVIPFLFSGYFVLAVIFFLVLLKSIHSEKTRD